MNIFLDTVGVKQEVLDLIPQIVDTCRICRQWAQPGPANVCSVDIPDTFNAQVECDLLFVKGRDGVSYTIFHMLCRCTRWDAGKVIANKE